MFTKKCSHPQCALAGQEQSIHNFGLDNSRKDGYAYYCKACARRNAKLNQVKNKHGEGVEFMRAVDKLIFGTPSNWAELTEAAVPSRKRKDTAYYVQTLRRLLELSLPMMLPPDILMQVDWKVGLQRLGDTIEKHKEQPTPSVAEILMRVK